MADYCNDITTLDTKVGEWMALLKRRGLADSTVLIYTSDHGAQFPHGKWTNYDAGLHVPFAVRWPGKIAPAAATDAMISFVDVLPTLMEIAGGRAPDDIDGRSFLPVLLGSKTDHRDVVYGAHTNLGIIACKEPYPIRSVRTRTHKYIRNLSPTGQFTNLITEGGHPTTPTYWREWKERAKTDPFAAERVQWYERRPPEELYDLRTDPHELHNIAADSANAALLAKLRKQLDDWMVQQGDKGEEKK